MFVLAAVVPVKIAFDTVSGTMANAGSSGPMPTFAPRSQARSYPLQTTQPQRQNEKIQELGSYTKYQEPTVYLGSYPIVISCPSCFALIETKVVYETGSNPPSCAFLYCGSKSIKDALHYCPKCHAYLGKYEP